ncbi:MAG: glycosyltransferase family 39 protein [Chloroflexi bacterium]|nr:glycosyltransferase family 39 protein [Chloroflexota bacterium]
MARPPRNIQATRGKATPVKQERSGTGAAVAPGSATPPDGRYVLRLSALRETWLAIGLALLAAMASVTVGWLVFEHIPHTEDELAFYFQAKVFALGRLFVPAPAEPAAFAAPFVIAHEGRWFGKYPPGHSLALALGMLVDLPWLVNPVAGALALFFVYRIGALLYTPAIGVAAILLAITSPYYLIQSASFLAHPTALLATVLFVYGVLLRERGAGLRWSIVAGLALGWLFLNRPVSAVAVAVPLALYVAWSTVRETGWRDLVPKLVRRHWLAALVFLPAPPLFVAYTTLLTGDPNRTPYELVWAFDRYGFGPGIGSLGRHDLHLGRINTMDNVRALARDLFGWPFASSLLLLPLAPILPGRKAADWFMAGWALAIVAFYAAYWSSGLMYGARYYFEALPPLLFLTIRGALALVAVLFALIGQPAPSSRHSARVAYGILALLVAVNVVTYLPFHLARFRGWYGITRANLDAVERAGIANALVFVAEANRSWDGYGSTFPANSPLLDSSVVFAMDRTPELNRAVAANFPRRELYHLRAGVLQPYRPG